MDYIFSIFLLIIVFIVLGFFIVRGILFKIRFNKIVTGMSFNQVISQIGYPKSSTQSGDITTCIWIVRVLRGVNITRVIVFKDDKVFSFLSG